MEGTMFVVLVASYFFLRTRTASWPPEPLRAPDLLWGTLNTVIILASCVPNHFAVKAAKRLDLRGVRLWTIVTLLFAVAFALIRILEFKGLNCRWDQNAYSSIVWMNMGFHTTHIVTDMIDTLVLIALMFVGPIEGKRFVDVAENGTYWYFVVALWVPLYVVLYIAPRFL
jgi:heme/copper-type cytochrome/quinol oxidase subunit 3